MSTTRFVLLIAGAAAVAGAPLGYRTGLLPVNAALGLLVVGLLPSLWVVVAGVLMLVRGGGAAQLDLRTVAALVLAAGVSAVPLAALVGGLGAPPIHDITSDTEDPPQFDVIVAERAGAPNPLDYRGAELAATQRAAYPDIQPLVVGTSAARGDGTGPRRGGGAWMADCCRGSERRFDRGDRHHLLVRIQGRRRGAVAACR